MRVLCGAVIAWGCTNAAEPHLVRIEPAAVTTLVATPAVIEGDALYAEADIDLAGDHAALDRGWRVRIGDVELTDVQWIDPQHVDVVVPRGVTPGVYDVVAISPRAREVVLPSALTVSAEPFGLALSIEDAPGGGGHPITASLAAGDMLTAFAVVRDRDGAFVTDIEVAWSATQPIGALGAGPASSSTLLAMKAGSGRMVATRAAAELFAESGDISVAAGPAARLVIENAPGGAGQPIVDVAGLTTDATGTLSAFATARDAFDNFAGDAAATWSLTGVTGVVPASATSQVVVDFSTPGTGVLHATAMFGSAQTGNLLVAPGRATALAIAPPTLTISADAAPRTFTAIGTDADGNATTNLGTLAWSVATGPITAIDAATGSFDPTRAGSGSVRVTNSYGASATSGSIIVQPGAATNLAIVPPTLAISADAQPTTFTATGTDADGNPTTSFGTLTWSVATGPITTMSPAGVFDPRAAGTGTIRATSSRGATKTAAVTVTPGRAATLVTSPDSVDVVAGMPAVAFSVTAADADGNATTDLGTIAWSKTGTFATLATSGMLTPTAAGTGTVLATSSYGPIDSTNTVRVRQPATLTAALSVQNPIGYLEVATATLTVTNIGESTAVAVTPCALTQTPIDAGTVTIGAGPSPASTTIAAGSSAQFTWTVTGETAGALRLSSCATGNDAITSATSTTAAATATMNVRPPATLAATITIPDFIGRSTPFTVSMQVTNSGSGPALGVMPSALTKTGTATATLISSPSGGLTIPPGGSVTFTWTYSATPGTLRFSGSASGTDAMSTLAITTATVQSNLANVGEAFVVDVDPFGDGSKFGFVCAYHDEVLLGPNATGTTAVAFDASGGNQHGFTFSTPLDANGNKMQNKALAPFTSIGAAGCTPDTQSCGPDNEDGRGTFTTVSLSGTEWLVAAGAHSGNNTHYVYMTTDTDAVLDMRYVDVSNLVGDHLVGVTSLAASSDVVYLGAAGDDAKRPRLFALKTTPPAPGLDAAAGTDLVDLKIQSMPGIQAGAPVEKLDTVNSFNSRLYFANPGTWARSTVAVPREYAAFPGDWAIITPSASAYSSKTSRTSTKKGNWEPSDRAVPQMAQFGGRIFAGRNTTSGPQLWSCNPAATGDPAQCDAGDWTHIAKNSASCILFFCNGDTQLTQFDDDSLTSITMVVATATHLYVGFDSTDGVKVYRTSNPAASTQSDFEGLNGCVASQSCAGYGGNGLGNASVTRIFDGKALTLAGSTNVWITAGSSTTPMVLVELP